jgi:hypothetical protein
MIAAVLWFIAWTPCHVAASAGQRIMAAAGSGDARAALAAAPWGITCDMDF